jgi:hypothetical protein
MIFWKAIRHIWGFILYKSKQSSNKLVNYFLLHFDGVDTTIHKAKVNYFFLLWNCFFVPWSKKHNNGVKISISHSVRRCVGSIRFRFWSGAFLGNRIKTVRKIVFVTVQKILLFKVVYCDCSKNMFQVIFTTVQRTPVFQIVFTTVWNFEVFWHKQNELRCFVRFG